MELIIGALLMAGLMDMIGQPTNMWGTVNRLPSLFGQQEPPKRIDYKSAWETIPKKNVEDRFHNWYKEGNHGYKTMQSLRPEVRMPLKALIDDVYRTTGMMMKVNTLEKGGGFRTPAQQQEMYELYQREGDVEGSSRAKPFQSAHSHALGVDFSIFKPDGEKGEVTYEKKLYREIGDMALKHGLQNAPSIGDYNHLMPLGWESPDKRVNKPDDMKPLGRRIYENVLSPLGSKVPRSLAENPIINQIIPDEPDRGEYMVIPNYEAIIADRQPLQERTQTSQVQPVLNPFPWR